MNLGFAFRHAGREGRSGLRRIGVYAVSIALGVAALVAVHSFRADVEGAVRAESRTLLGADLRLERGEPFSDSTRALADSLRAGGAEVSEVTALMSMVYAPSSDRSRLVQLHGVEGRWPMYGDVRTDPPGLWPPADGGRAVADPALLVQLGVQPGDTLQVGDRSVVLAGTVEGLPADLGFQTAVGPRVFVPAATLEATGLVTYGSLVRHRLFFRFADPGDAGRVEERYDDELRDRRVDADTAGETARTLTRRLETLSRFLSLVGLVALLLGGVGVGSAVHVYVKERLDGMAVLRCLGATEREVFLAYLLQAGALGLLGAGAGAVLGLGVQAALPGLLGDLLPVDVAPSFRPGPVAAGVTAGVWIAAVFALVPLLEIREVAPLRALRRDVDPDGRSGRDPLRIAAYGALAGSLLLVGVWQAPTVRIGLWFTVALAGALAALYALARALVAAVRRLLPEGVAYPLRYGAANLFRPRNQTATIVVALGFAAFLVVGIGQVRESLLRGFSLELGEGRPNVLLFDVQPDQEEGVREILAGGGAEAVRVTPVVPAHLASVEGRTVEELLADSSGARPPRWALTRMYRNTYRARSTDAEELVAGRWWEFPPREQGDDDPSSGPAAVSLEADLADDLGVDVGDRLTWDVQGVRIESEIRSLRRVDWDRFEPNFFAVFEPGALDRAPQTLVVLARVTGADRREALQGSLARTFPNVSVLDLARIQETVEGILEGAAGAVRFLAGFCALAGLIVLVGALATSRFRRLREGALLRTLGARRPQILGIVLAEYAGLGAVAGAAGILLGVAGGWAAVRFLFELDFHLRVAPLLGVWGVVTLVTAAVGGLAAREVLRDPPLAVLRRTPD